MTSHRVEIPGIRAIFSAGFGILIIILSIFTRFLAYRNSIYLFKDPFALQSTLKIVIERPNEEYFGVVVSVVVSGVWALWNAGIISQIGTIFMGHWTTFNTGFG
jgi:hypothetical protein